MKGVHDSTAIAHCYRKSAVVAVDVAVLAEGSNGGRDGQVHHREHDSHR